MAMATSIGKSRQLEGLSKEIVARHRNCVGKRTPLC